MEKGHWEAPIVELDNPNYAKAGAKMMNLERNEVDVDVRIFRHLGVSKIYLVYCVVR
jgi:hypothetical protein